MTKKLYKIDMDCSVKKENLYEFFENELKKTNLKKKDIKVSRELRNSLAMLKISMILADNDISEDLIEVDYENNSLYFVHSANNILISKIELNVRFNDVLESTLDYLKRG
jgi:hypothetical protein